LEQCRHSRILAASILDFGGDFAACARQLAAEGFGHPATKEEDGQQSAQEHSPEKSILDGKITIRIAKTEKDSVTLVAFSGEREIHSDSISLDKATNRDKFIKALRINGEKLTAEQCEQPQASLQELAGAARSHTADQAEAGRDTQGQVLINLALKISKLFHDAGGNCYATVLVGTHEETYKLGSRDFKDWLAGEYFKTTERGIPSPDI
jgi:hypothetical protein